MRPGRAAAGGAPVRGAGDLRRAAHGRELGPALGEAHLVQGVVERHEFVRRAHAVLALRTQPVDPADHALVELRVRAHRVEDARAALDQARQDLVDVADREGVVGAEVARPRPRAPRARRPRPRAPGRGRARTASTRPAAGRESARRPPPARRRPSGSRSRCRGGSGTRRRCCASAPARPAGSRSRRVPMCRISRRRRLANSSWRACGPRPAASSSKVSWAPARTNSTSSMKSPSPGIAAAARLELGARDVGEVAQELADVAGRRDRLLRRTRADAVEEAAGTRRRARQHDRRAARPRPAAAARTANSSERRASSVSACIRRAPGPAPGAAPPESSASSASQSDAP